MKCPKCHADNPETKPFCGDCGTQLSTPRTQDRLPVVTETLQIPVHELATGSTFAARYQVIEELGHGGMGRVYKVLDAKIGEKVALKLLRPEAGLDRKSLERFANELKLARKIRHKNVCQMFDLGEDQGTRYITMEYVHGEDLKQLIRKVGRLSPSQAVAIARQMCEGLEEAHKLGVVHRDLKPQNIMVDADGDIRIMDFGIAKSLSVKSTTGAGVMIGTPEYMSPEQVEGQDVDQRSDIYSLGVILFEMLTGRPPFAGETPLSVAHKHKYEAPEDPRKLNTQVSGDLARVVLKCLAKNAAQRYQRAGELGTELGRIEDGLPTATRLMAEKKPTTSREITLKVTPRKLLVPGLAVLAVVAAGLVLSRVIPSKKPAPAPSSTGRPTLAVLYFENKSGDPKLDNWRDMLSELLITSLSQSRYMRVVTGEEIYTILKRLGLTEAPRYSSEDIERIAAQARATHVLRGSFIKAGDGFIITAGLQKPGATENPPPIQLEAANDRDVIVKASELARQVKEGLDLTATQLANDSGIEANKITTSSPEALQYYVEGRRYQQRLDGDKAILYLKKAVEIDPGFAMAYRALRLLCGDTAEGRYYSQKAMELSANLPDNERLLIEAGTYVRVEDNARAIEAFEKLVKAYPDNTIGQTNLGANYLRLGEVDKAIEHLEIAHRIDPSALDTGNLARAWLAKGLYQRAEDLCRSFLRDVEDNYYVRNQLRDSYLLRKQFGPALAETERLAVLDPSYRSEVGNILLLKGDLAGAEKVYRELRENDSDSGRNGLYCLARIQGKFQAALGLAQQGLKESKGRKDRESQACRELAGWLEISGRFDEAYQAAVRSAQAWAEYRTSLGDAGPPYLPSRQMDELFWKGKLLAEKGSFEEARTTAEEMKSLIDKGVNVKELPYYEYILGQVEFGKKDYARAAEYFSRACEREKLVDFEGDAGFLEGLARALFELGDLEKARQKYETITLQTLGRLNRGDLYAKAFYMLGKISERQGDKARASENYRRFLDFWKDADPGLPEVPDAKARLAAMKGNGSGIQDLAGPGFL
jgi:serine/threonine protein kinase/tetratricopeptide (TPR) repeat protein